jgi:hypothetical protein
MAICAMLGRFALRFLILTTFLTLLGGTPLHAVPWDRLPGEDARSAVTAMATTCDQLNDMTGADDSSDDSPCGSTKQIDYTDVFGFPCVAALETRVAFAIVGYWIALPRPCGLSHKPDVFPPISI